MTATFLVSDMIEETRRNLLGTSRGELNRLTSDITSGATTLTVDFDLLGIARNSYISIDDELMLVWSVVSSSKTVTVQRAQLGSTAAAHTAGAMVYVNPRFPSFTIRSALREEIRSWGPQLFQVKTATISTVSDVRGYDLTALGNFYNILDVRRSSPTSVGQTDALSWPRVRFKVMRNASTTNFSSGNALVLDQTPMSPLPTLNIIYSLPYDVDTAFTDSTNLVTDVGLDSGLMDIAPIGASWRLLATREIKRTFTEGAAQPADLRDVPPMFITNAAKELKKIRDQRLAEEALQLRARYAIVQAG